jgi:hypothetical protein
MEFPGPIETAERKEKARIADSANSSTDRFRLEMRRRLGLFTEVTAPDDFLKRLHERLDREQPLKRITKKLFFPLGRKIPLELAAAVSTALVVILLLQVLPLSRSHPTTREETPPRESFPRDVSHAELSVRPEGNSSVAQLNAEHGQRIEQARVSKKRRKETQKVTGEPGKSEIAPQKAPAAAEPGSLLDSGLKGHAGAPLRTDVRIFFCVVQAEQEGKPSARTKAKKSISDEEMEYGSPREIALIIELVNRYSKRGMNGERQNSITFEIPRASYEKFLEELGDYGQYRLETVSGIVENPADVEGSSATVRVSIEFTR